MTEYQIEADFQNALRKADRLDQIAGEVVKEIQRIETIQHSLSLAWQSDHSRDYIGKMTIVQQNLQKREREIRRSAEDIRQTARDLRDADLRALEIARQRSYQANKKR